MLEQRAIDVIPYGGDQPARAALEGQPLVTRWPNSPTTKAILGLGERLDQQLAEARAISSASFLTVP
jgi:MinD-like ATPase involved in chromosome partitioning or flagellar assembly